MNRPHVKQIRRPITVTGGARKWEVTTIIDDPGDLPFPEIFVITISDAADPKGDVFARVADPFEFRFAIENGPIYVKVRYDDLITLNNDPFARVASPSELTAMPRDRVSAVRAGKTEFLTSVITLVYDALDTADAAYRQLDDRMSALVDAWVKASGQFVTTPSRLYYLPVVSAAEEARLAGIWQASRTARVTAEVTRDAAVTASANCAASGTYTDLRYQDLVRDVAFLQHARNLVSAMTEEATITSGSGTAVASVNVRTFVLNGSDTASYETLLTEKRGQLATALLSVQAHEAQCTDLRRAALAAQAAVEVAQQTERSALAALLAVCPTYLTTG